MRGRTYLGHIGLETNIKRLRYKYYIDRIPMNNHHSYDTSINRERVLTGLNKNR
jgi:hypothetical protein